MKSFRIAIIHSSLRFGPVCNSSRELLIHKLVDFANYGSDILAELHVPMSGILTYEETMPIPNVTAAVEFDHIERTHIESYMTQLNLRKHLNQLHTMFYKPSESDGKQES